MQDYEKLGIFYLGHEVDRDLKDDPSNLVLYESRDLLTHAVCIGMTGSGKTGTCITFIEEAAMDGIPTVAIDPKGDISNLLLTFPELTSAEFLPWVNPDDAKRQGVSLDSYADKEAQRWRKGLEATFQSGDRIKKLKDKAEFLIYTPGSTAGLPVSIVESFQSPNMPNDSNKEEMLAQTASQAASSLLALLGIDADPLKSREHILLSNIFNHAWAEGKNLDFIELIRQIQKPPFELVGALDVESFFPASDRFKFALSLNNLLAAPSFQSWNKGEPLDFSQLMYGPNGKPRVIIFSISHLSDQERMFFVTLALNKLLTWMCRQSGTTSLRALLYMDEIFGFFPPVANPPSKQPLLTLLKQGRAFGLGVLLASQNPVDLDYKGLTNAGTWIIGRLQTERDKMRVMQGLQGAAAESGGTFNQQAMEQTLASLTNRVFLLNNVHQNAAHLMKSRFTMSYLRGPLTREQVQLLMDPVKASAQKSLGQEGKVNQEALDKTKPAIVGVSPKNAQSDEISKQRPVLPPKIKQYFMTAYKASDKPDQKESLPSENVIRGKQIYRGNIFASLKIRFADVKAGVDFWETRAFVLSASDGLTADELNWTAASQIKIASEDLKLDPIIQDAYYEHLNAAACRPENYPSWEKQVITWAVTTQKTFVLKNDSLKIYSKPGETEKDFQVRINHTTNEQRDSSIDGLKAKYAAKLAKMDDRIRLAQQKVALHDQDLEQQQRELAINAGATIIGALFKRRNSGSAISKVKNIAKDFNKDALKKQELDMEKENLNKLTEDRSLLEQQIDEEIKELQKNLDAKSAAVAPYAIAATRTNIVVNHFGLLWVPSEKSLNDT